jgi:hypothetical protein
VWHNLTVDGRDDPDSLHEGRAVRPGGEKATAALFLYASARSRRPAWGLARSF